MIVIKPLGNANNVSKWMCKWTCRVTAIFDLNLNNIKILAKWCKRVKLFQKWRFYPFAFEPFIGHVNILVGFILVTATKMSWVACKTIIGRNLFRETISDTYSTRDWRHSPWNATCSYVGGNYASASAASCCYSDKSFTLALLKLILNVPNTCRSKKWKFVFHVYFHQHLDNAPWMNYAPAT